MKEQTLFLSVAFSQYILPISLTEIRHGNKDYSCENRSYLFKDCCIQGVGHHHLRWAGTQSWGEEWKSFIVKKGEAWVFLWRKMTGTSVQFSPSVVSDALQPHGLQHTRPPCPSPTPGACSDSCPSSRWCHPTISSSVVPFSSCLQSFPASGSFPVSQFFASGGQSTGASASVLPMNIQDWFPLGWTGWISLQSKGQETRGGLTRGGLASSRASYVIGLVSILGFLWLVQSWKGRPLSWLLQLLRLRSVFWDWLLQRLSVRALCHIRPSLCLSVCSVSLVTNHTSSLVPLAGGNFSAPDFSRWESFSFLVYLLIIVH